MSMDDQKRSVGRPRTYESGCELEQAINAYFEECESKERSATVPGLAYYLGFADKRSIYNYRDDEREEFSHPIKRALLRLEGQRNEQALTFPAGVIFDLKNHHDWRDKNETEITGKDGAPLHPSPNLSKLTDEELALYERLSSKINQS